MSTTVTDDDSGKRLLDGEERHVGIVDEVRDGTAYVDPDPDIDDDLKSKLGWGTNDRTTYPLREDAIDEVTDEAIRLRNNYA